MAISDSASGYYRPDGIDVPGALRYSLQSTHSLRGYQDAQPITNAELLELDVDVLIPSALGGVITAENAGRIKAPIIVEGSQLRRRSPRPTTSSPRPARRWCPTSWPTPAA